MLLLAFIALGFVAIGSPNARAEVLLDDAWSDGSRTETNLPDEAAVYAGRDNDVTVAEGSLSTTMSGSSQKIWTYFTEADPIVVNEGQTLTASVSFIPRRQIYEHTSRSFRIGLFYDENSPRTTTDTNSDGGGEGDPWMDSQGYAVQVLLTGGTSYSATFDLGKRVSAVNKSLLGSSDAYWKVSGGMPASIELDKEYTVKLAIERESPTKVNVTASLWQGEEQLSTWNQSDDGRNLGRQMIYVRFDQLFVRIGDNATSADQIDFTNFKVTLE